MYSLARLFLSVIFKASTILSSESCLATELRDRISFPTEMFFFLICLCCGRENSNCMVQILMCSFPDCMIFFFRELLSNWTKKEGVLSPESCTEEWSTDKVCVFLKSTANCSKAVNNAFKPNQSNSLSLSLKFSYDRRDLFAPAIRFFFFFFRLWLW